VEEGGVALRLSRSSQAEGEGRAERERGGGFKFGRIFFPRLEPELDETPVGVDRSCEPAGRSELRERERGEEGLRERERERAV
jgi:hypothetical protein